MVEDLSKEPIGRKGASTGATTYGQRESVGEKVREGWMDFKGKIRQKWNQLTDKDLDAYQSKNRNEFVGYVHNKVGGDRTMIERDIDTLAKDTNYRWP